MIKFPTTKRVDLYKTAVSSEQLHLDLVAAQEFMFDARENDDSEVVLKLIRKAIKKSPLCADAYSFYCEISQEPPESKIGKLETALYAASIALGEDFQEFAGRFWGFVETRPYMRAKAALAEALWESGNFYPAMAHSREMLKLNPNDNRGIRHLLANYYLELEMVDDLALLLDDYPGICVRFFSIHAPYSPTDSHPRMPMISLKLRLILIDTSPACYRSADYRSSLTVDISR